MNAFTATVFLHLAAVLKLEKRSLLVNAWNPTFYGRFPVFSKKVNAAESGRKKRMLALIGRFNKSSNLPKKTKP